ncbi:MAG: type II toxin-antitoxin system PrlF family antitoxin [Chloroflexi bacterium]|nr:type II toxin-antitoxin system PrlF family antitoxin [Chloroflexota bacterium]MDA8188311.1 type II toxin-antitoxin system PrlF family antitoxin [Dehalococcoidales bacterium]
MKEIVTAVTKRGQVTIPAEVRGALGTKPRDKVAFQIDGDQVRLARAKFILETAYGSVKPLRRPEDYETVTHTAKEEHVKQVVRKMLKNQ